MTHVTHICDLCNIQASVLYTFDITSNGYKYTDKEDKPVKLYNNIRFTIDLCKNCLDEYEFIENTESQTNFPADKEKIFGLLLKGKRK